MSKILILTNNDAGLYDFRKEIVQALIEESYEVHISTPDNGYIDKLAGLGAVMHVTALDRRGMNPVKDLKLYQTYKQLIKEINPEAVLTYTIKPNVYGGVACRMARIPGKKKNAQGSGVTYMPTVTGLGTTLQGDGPVQRMVKLMYKTGLKGATCIFFQNEYNRRFMIDKGCISGSAHTRMLAGSGVNLEEHKLQPYPAETCDKIHILNIGRIMNDKGSSELLAAAEQLHEAHPELIFDILGGFEEETKLKYEPWVKRLEEKGALKYYGFRDDVDAFYSTCHALIHASYHEGMSNVVQEAAAAGRPVLTTDIPGCREIYENGVGGIAFEPKSKEAIVDAVEQFLNMSYEARVQMGLNARQFVSEHFDRKLVVESYLEEIKKG